MTKILVVDDMVDAAESLAMLFTACGHETHIAHDGMQGLASAKKHVPHIVFLDLDMPLLDGYGAARAIRASKDTDHPFIVALTAQTGSDVQRRTDEAGFDFYLRKPASTNTLLTLVSDLATRQRVN
jgi:CheY-like chemotaxis protein